MLQEGKVCIQGLLTYTTADASTGGLCVVVGSHKQHTDLCKRYEASANVSMSDVPSINSFCVCVVRFVLSPLLWNSLAQTAVTSFSCFPMILSSMLLQRQQTVALLVLIVSMVMGRSGWCVVQQEISFFGTAELCTATLQV